MDYQNTNQSFNNQVVKPNFLIRFISLLILLGGIFSASWAIIYYSFYSYGGIFEPGDFPVNIGRQGIFLGINGIVLIITGYGLRKMKLWSLYLYATLTAGGIIYALYQFSKSTDPNLAGLLGTLIIELIILIYFWSTRKDFV